MRVLTVIDSLDGSGGAERSLAAIAPALQSLGIEQHVAFLRARPQSVSPQLRATGVEVHSLAGARGRLASAWRVNTLARALRPDLVHTTLFEADQAGRVGGRLAHCPVVSSLVTDGYGRDQSATPGVRSWKLKSAQATDITTARLVVRFHAITSHVADVMAARLRIPRTRIDVVPRGRDPAVLGRRDEVRRARARRDLGVDDSQPVIVAVGRQEWVKGHDVLLEATLTLLAKWPSLQLVIAGRAGLVSDELRSFVTRHQLDEHVRILGFRDDVAELLCAADVFAFPSRWEGLGSTLLEAMALEAPIVASDLPAVREVVTAEEARLVPPSDAVALADALSELLDDPAEARRQSAAARAHFLSEFTIESCALGMTNFYQRAINREDGS